MDFETVLNNCKNENNVKKIAVAAAHDEHVLKAMKYCLEKDLGEFILIGEEKKINEKCKTLNIVSKGFEVIDEPNDEKASQKAVTLVKENKAHIVMKGLVGTSTFLKAILNKEFGIRKEKLLSHVAVFEIKERKKLLIITDCAMNIAPSLGEKITIIKNAVKVSKALGVEKAKIAAVCAVETVNPQMQATVDAALLAKMAERGQLGNVLLDGPLAFDNAISKEAALHKGIDSDVAGDADILLVPNIEAGNVLYKSLTFLAKADSAGIILGAKAPVVLTSRSDSFETKIRSIALSIQCAF